MSDILIYLIAVCLGVILPIILASALINADWLAIAAAFLLWPGFLYQWLADGWTIQHDAIAWATGFAMLSNWFFVPLLSAIIDRSFRWVK